MEHINIKAVTLHDIDQLQTIGRQTFFETFSANNSEENMKAYLEKGFAKEQLKTELSNPHSQFYFAALDETIIGYLKLNTGQAQTELKAEGALEIERIYVLQAYHGKKVGQLLYEKALQIARELHADYIWLGVWENNERAVRFYKKNGFVAFDKHLFKLGNDVQTDIMMKLQLKA